MVKERHLAGHAGTSSSCALRSNREPWPQSLNCTCRIVDVPDDLSWALFAYSGAASAAGQVYTGAVLCTPDGRWPVPAAEHRINAALRFARLLPSQLTHNAALAKVCNVTPCQQAGMSVSTYGWKALYLQQMALSGFTLAAATGEPALILAARASASIWIYHGAAGWQALSHGSCLEWTTAAARGCPWAFQKRMLPPTLPGSHWL